MSKINDKTNTKREYYLDLLRILCCFSVVIIHVAAIYFYDCDIKDSNWNISVFFDAIVRFAVPVFFMISGALFLKKKDLSIKKLYTKNILKILIILAIWLPVYGVVSYMYVYNHSVLSLAILKDIIIGLLDYQFQFWFLVPLISIYMCMPFLQKIAEDKKILKYFLILFAIFQIVIPSLSPIPELGGYKYKALMFFAPRLVLGYYGYFLLGHYLNIMEITPKKENIIYTLGIISIIIAIVGTIWISNNAGEKFEFFFSYYTITTAIASVAIFIFFKQRVSKVNFKDKTKKLISKLSSYTMGVYIFHVIIKWIIEKNFNMYFTTALITVPLVSIIIFILSIVITIIVKKIPFIGKYIV